jgi:hypothetical protein
LYIFFLVWLTSFLIYKASSESRDSDDRMEEVLERIERRLDAIGGGPAELAGGFCKQTPDNPVCR